MEKLTGAIGGLAAAAVLCLWTAPALASQSLEKCQKIAQAESGNHANKLLMGSAA